MAPCSTQQRGVLLQDALGQWREQQRACSEPRHLQKRSSQDTRDCEAEREQQAKSLIREIGDRTERERLASPAPD